MQSGIEERCIWRLNTVDTTALPDLGCKRLKKVTSSEIMAKLMEAKKVAMEGLIRYDSCEKIYRELNSNIRRTIVEDLQVGDEVYY